MEYTNVNTITTAKTPQKRANVPSVWQRFCEYGGSEGRVDEDEEEEEGKRRSHGAGEAWPRDGLVKSSEIDRRVRV